MLFFPHWSGTVNLRCVRSPLDWPKYRVMFANSSWCTRWWVWGSACSSLGFGFTTKRSMYWQQGEACLSRSVCVISVSNCVSEWKEEMEKCLMRRSHCNPDPNQPSLNLILTSNLIPHLKPQTNKTKTDCRRLLNIYEILEGLRGIKRAKSHISRCREKPQGTVFISLPL